MSLNGTYSGLLASIADFLNRTDLTASIPDFVVLAEADLERKLRVRLMTTIVTASVNAQYETVPTDFAGAISMQRSDGTPVDERSIDALNLITADNASATGLVTDYAVLGAAFQFYPIPTTAQTVTLTYYQKIPSLVTNGSNWLFTAHPDAYLYGSLVSAAPYLQDDDRLQVWESLYGNALSAIKKNDRERYGSRLTPQPSVTQII